jgi:hypothetical protein
MSTARLFIKAVESEGACRQETNLDGVGRAGAASLAVGAEGVGTTPTAAFIEH